MAAPGGILHKVQLHFEKCIQLAAVSPLSFFPPVFSPSKKKKKKKKKNIPGIYLRLLLLSPLYLYWGGGSRRRFRGTGEPRFIFTEASETRTQTCDCEWRSNSIWHFPSAIGPSSTLAVPYAFQTDEILWASGLKILQSGDKQQLNSNANFLR